MNLFKIVPAFIVVVFVMIVLFWVSVAYFAGKAFDEVGQHGLKAVVERLWCGPSGCK